MTTAELIEIMSKSKDGHVIFDIEGFEEAYKCFKEEMKKQLPDFTEEELLKFYDNYYEFTKLFEWKYMDQYFTLLRNEIQNK